MRDDGHDQRGVAAVLLLLTAIAGLIVGASFLPTDGPSDLVKRAPAASVVECAAAHSPRVALADALPAKGHTDESYVRAVLRSSRDQIKKHFPGTVEAHVAPRNGEVWSRDANGTVFVEALPDYWIVVQLASAKDCPGMPWDWNGVPLQFVAPT